MNLVEKCRLCLQELPKAVILRNALLNIMGADEWLEEATDDWQEKHIMYLGRGELIRFKKIYTEAFLWSSASLVFRIGVTGPIYRTDFEYDSYDDFTTSFDLKEVKEAQKVSYDYI